MGLGAILFAVLGNTRHYVDAFLPCWLTVGAGAGLAIPTLFSSATVNLAPEQTATGSAILDVQQIGADGISARGDLGSPGGASLSSRTPGSRPRLRRHRTSRVWDHLRRKLETVVDSMATRHINSNSSDLLDERRPTAAARDGSRNAAVAL
jgi:hypothetical protein